MTKEQETLKYFSAMRIIDYDKLGFVYGKETIDEVLNLIQQLQEENKQKDKIIDEMIEEYEFVHRVNIINFCEDKLRENTCIQDCKSCIKQYFKKKAQEIN